MWFGRKIEASDGSFAITGRKVTPPEPARMVIGPPSYWREVGPTVRGGGETGRSLSVGTLEEKVIRGDTSEVDFLRAERTRTEERLQRQRITRHGPSTLPPTLVARLRRLGIRA